MKKYSYVIDHQPITLKKHNRTVDGIGFGRYGFYILNTDPNNQISKFYHSLCSFGTKPCVVRLLPADIPFCPGLNPARLLRKQTDGFQDCSEHSAVNNQIR